MASLPTRRVTCRLFDQQGNAAAGSRIQFRLTVPEVIGGVVAPEVFEMTADEDGVALFDVVPNVLGTNGSQYRVRAWNADTGRKFIDGYCTVPDHDSELHQILLSDPPPTIDSAQQALIAAQQAALDADAARDEAVALGLYYGPTPPPSPIPNKRWLNSLTGQIFTWIVDVDSGQWVETGATVAIGATTAAAAEQAATDAEQAAAQAAASAQLAQDAAASAGLNGATIDAGYNLVVTLGNGDSFVVGYVRGEQGPAGQSFTVDATGADLSERAAYDGSPAGFSYLDIAGGNLYFREGTSGWSDPVPFGKGEKGDTGDPGPAGTTDFNALSNKPTLGTAAALNVAASGDATAGQVVKGDDTRLTDARAPTAHSHLISAISDAGATGATLLAAATAGAAKTALQLENVTNLSAANLPISDATAAALLGKQATLVSGENLKMINGQSLLGAGNITVAGSGSGDMLKSVYDPNNDGKVSAAAAADSVPWTGVQSKPTTFTPSAHTHSRADISDGVALYRIVVIGDSYTAQQPLLSASWPAHLERALNGSGALVEVINLAINGWTFNKANTVGSFGASTMVQKCISLAPDMVIVALGNNDATLSVESRTLTQIKADAAATLSTIATALPTATLVYASELAYDATHGTPGALKNRHVMPALMKQATTGLLANCYCSGILGDAVAAGTNTNYSNWAALDTYIKALPEVDASFTLNIWKAARLGLRGYDGVHLTAEGNVFLGAYARKAFKDVSALATAVPSLSNQSYASFDDPESIFSALLSSDGSKYNELVPTTEVNHPVAHWGPWRACAPASWYLPSRGTIVIPGLSHISGTVFSWVLTGMPPLTQVETSVNGAAWGPAPGKTNERGDYVDADVLSAAAGTYTFLYKVGNEVIGPVDIVIEAGSGGSGSTSKAVGRLWGVQGSYANTSNDLTDVFYSVTPSTLINGMTVDAGGGSKGPSLIVPRDGLYRITAAALNISTAANIGCFLRLLRTVGGIDYPTADGATIYVPFTSSAAVQTISTMVSASAGDAFRLQTFVIGSASQQNTPAGLNTGNYFIVEEV